MSIQSLFRRFHETIQLKRFSENAELREKRDRILKRLRDNMSHSFEPFNQGSYAMGTGIKPLNGDYDIDVGIVLDDVDYRRHQPVEVKRWVYEAVLGHTTRVEWRRPCITVYYQQSGEALYHVDLAIMAKDAYGTLRLALGKEHSSLDQQEWQVDDRAGFMEAVENRFTGEDAFQFRRVIRYLKRWKDVHFSSEGHAAPTGLSITAAALRWFQPRKTHSYTSVDYDDLAATASLVRSIQQGFTQIYSPNQGRYVLRLQFQFPNAPYDDVFRRMTDQQMQEFHQRLEKLSGWLEDARRTQSTAPLRRAFGQDFPDS